MRRLKQANLLGVVIEFATQSERRVQARSLRLTRKQTILESALRYLVVSHAVRVSITKDTVRSQELSQAASDFVPHHNTPSHHHIHKKRPLAERAADASPA